MDDIIERMFTLSSKGEPFVLITVVKTEGSSPSTPGQMMILDMNGTTYGSVGGGTLEMIALEKANKLLEKKGTLLEEYRLDEKSTDMVCGGKTTLFYQYIGPRNRLYIFGGGHIGKEIASIMRGTGFSVVVIDPREVEIDGAIHIKEEYNDFLKKHSIEDGAFIVVCTPQHTWDYQVLKNLDGTNPGYIGLVASKRKFKTIFDKLKKETRNFPFDVLHSPAGLNIGGRLPKEIAISISAEIQKVRYGL
ncbi:hypothetical protein DRQ17_02460 [bacterium]|nr:MAG: hypothetical protein DRQ17_02460 [bacterium]RKZ23882.1 MAG: hypothetical protein DRQ23_01880 [bacterium]